MSDDKQPQRSNLLAPEEGIAERIKTRRKELDLTVEALSELTVKYDFHEEGGVSPASIYRYEKGGDKGSMPGARELRLLSYALDMSPSVLLLGKEWSQQAEEDARLANAFRELLTLSKPEGIASKGDEWRSIEHSKKLAEVMENQSKSK